VGQGAPPPPLNDRTTTGITSGAADLQAGQGALPHDIHADDVERGAESEEYFSPNDDNNDFVVDLDDDDYIDIDPKDDNGYIDIDPESEDEWRSSFPSRYSGGPCSKRSGGPECPDTSGMTKLWQMMP
jgi:hypothetical protein